MLLKQLLEWELYKEKTCWIGRLLTISMRERVITIEKAQNVFHNYEKINCNYYSLTVSIFFFTEIYTLG